jgi:5-methylcytosine-specific restriction protein A
VLATQVDHIVPLSQGGTDVSENLQSICDDCHDAKSAREAGAKPIVGCDAEGWPA